MVKDSGAEADSGLTEDATNANDTTDEVEESSKDQLILPREEVLIDGSQIRYVWCEHGQGSPTVFISIRPRKSDVDEGDIIYRRYHIGTIYMHTLDDSTEEILSLLNGLRKLHYLATYEKTIYIDNLYPYVRTHVRVGVKHMPSESRHEARQPLLDSPSDKLLLCTLDAEALYLSKSMSACPDYIVLFYVQPGEHVVEEIVSRSGKALEIKTSDFRFRIRPEMPTSERQGKEEPEVPVVSQTKK